MVRVIKKIVTTKKKTLLNQFKGGNTFHSNRCYAIFTSLVSIFIIIIIILVVETKVSL